ncbi:MAG: thioredoxin family protein [Tepidisphaeraceae bacterium]|jgi:peroxiredoxin
MRSIFNRRSFYPTITTLGVAMAVALSLAAESTPPAAATIGQTAPGFELQNQDGQLVKLGSYSGKYVVLEWTNPECPFVQAHYKKHTMTNLAAKYKADDVQWIAINSSHDDTNAANKTWATAQDIPYSILNDASGAIGHAYGATNTPDMYIINKDGKLVYKGAIDNDPNDDQTNKINYVDRALSEILAGKPVSIPETKPYGCTVKYAE